MHKPEVEELPDAIPGLAVTRWTTRWNCFLFFSLAPSYRTKAGTALHEPYGSPVNDEIIPVCCPRL